MKLKVYVGHAISDAPREFLDEMERLKTLLREQDIEVIDRKWGEKTNVCNLIVAVCDYSSTELGMELGGALVGYSKTVLAFRNVERGASRSLIRSFLSFGLNSPVVYREIEEIVRDVEAFRRSWVEYKQFHMKFFEEEFVE